jgi:hypothetical protein
MGSWPCVLGALVSGVASPGFAQAADDAHPAQVTLGGITFHSGGEGDLERHEADGRVGWTVGGRGHYMYGDVAAVKTNHVRLEFTVHDGGFRGQVYTPYDSTDDAVVAEARWPGAWH